jgi:hypothetical protein
MKHHIHELEAISVNRPSGPTGATPDPIAAEMGPQKLLYGAHPLARNIGESLAIPQGHRGDNHRKYTKVTRSRIGAIWETPNERTALSLDSTH